MAFIGNTNITQAFTPAVDFFSGNGSTTAFTLSRPVASVAQVEVYVSNVPQTPSTAYTVSGNTITFTSAPLSGTNNIYVYYTSPITQVIAPSQGTVNTTSLGTITNIASGSSSLTLQTGASNTTAMTIDTSQNVGIGTSSFTHPFTVKKSNAGDWTCKFSNSSATGVSGFGYYDNSDTWKGYVGYDNGDANFLKLYATTSVGIKFITNTTEAMRIDSSGVITSGLGGMQVISGTSVTASGTSVNFTSIPSWVKRITVMFSGVSTNGTSNLLLQIGDSGGIENTGYTSCAQTDGGSSTVISSGFAVVYGVTAAGTNSGRIEISLITGTTWVASGVVGNNGGNVSSMFGNKALSDVLDRVRITTVAGTDTFDAGSINILYE